MEIIKQKIIFLDIDGVLNGYDFIGYIGWEFVCLLKNEYIKEWYRKISDPCGIHESKIRRLAKIVKKTNAKVVMSSSWRFGWWKTPYEEMYEDQKKLTDLLKKYEIDVIDITPRSIDGKRDKEILSWLSKHEDEVGNFIILDDENTLLRAFDNDYRFIQTSTVSLGQMICGHWKENTGLKRKHVKKAIRVLNRNDVLCEVNYK